MLITHKCFQSERKMQCPAGSVTLVQVNTETSKDSMKKEKEKSFYVLYMKFATHRGDQTTVQQVSHSQAAFAGGRFFSHHVMESVALPEFQLIVKLSSLPPIVYRQRKPLLLSFVVKIKTKRTKWQTAQVAVVFKIT